MDADAHGEPYALSAFQARVQRPHGVEDAQTSPDGPLSIIFMGLRIAKVYQQTITQILGNMPSKALDHLDTGRLIGQDNLTQVFRVELAGEASGVGEVTEQHCELAAFGVGRTWDVSSSGGRDIRHRGSLVRGAGCRGRCWGTCPHQDAALLIDGEPLSIDQGLLQRLQLFLVQLELEP
jgi:hypothetical protein